MGSRTYTFDALMQLSDGLTPISAPSLSYVSAAPKILDLGGGGGRSDLGAVGGGVRLEAALVIDVAALNVANANNNYGLILLGSNNADMSKPVVLGEIQLGHGASLPLGSAAGSASTGAGSTSTPGRYELLFATEQDDINYEFVALYVQASGTSPSIQFTAFVAVLPCQ